MKVEKAQERAPQLQSLTILFDGFVDMYSNIIQVQEEGNFMEAVMALN